MLICYQLWEEIISYQYITWTLWPIISKILKSWFLYALLFQLIVLIVAFLSRDEGFVSEIGSNFNHYTLTQRLRICPDYNEYQYRGTEIYTTATGSFINVFLREFFSCAVPPFCFSICVHFLSFKCASTITFLKLSIQIVPSFRD